jgi:hypothetical protein
MKPVVRHVPLSGFACFLCHSFRHKQKAPGHFAQGLRKTENFVALYRSELPLGRADSAESPNSFLWLFTSRSA